MSIGPHLISIPCPINSNSLINFTCQASTISIIPFMNYVTHTMQSIIYIYIYIYLYIYIYIYVSTYQAYPNNYKSSKDNQATKPRIVSPNPSLRLKGLAQARQSRSGEPPSPWRGLEKEIGTNAGSHLGETPLAWASGSLTENHELVAWATFREKGFRRASARLA